MDALAMGGAVAAAMAVPELREWCLARGRLIRPAAAGVFLVGAAVTKLYRQLGFLAQTAGYSLLAAAFALWVLSIAVGGGADWLKSRFLRAAGKYSYALYVFHFPFSMIWRRWMTGATASPVVNDVMQVVLASAIVWAMAMVSWRLVEAPVLRLKRHFEPAVAGLSSAGPRTAG
jgi:peptidoglycan/LPS O-acetylase OafA/YrhL